MHFQAIKRRNDNTMDEFLDERGGNDNENEIQEGILPLPVIEYQNDQRRDSSTSPNLIAPNAEMRKDSHYSLASNQIKGKNYRKDTFASPAFLNQTHNTFYVRPSFMLGNLKSQSYETNLIENLSPNKARFTFSRKKEFWKKSATRKKQIADSNVAISISKVLKKLKGLVSLKLNLNGFYDFFFFIYSLRFIQE